MYQFSTDFEELYRLICEGHTAVGFVDHRFDNHPELPTCRDVVQIKRRKPYDIQICARGIGYGSIDPWQQESWPSELVLFVATCEAIHLEFIPAQATA
jgi:hypothetical protein